MALPTFLTKFTKEPTTAYCSKCKCEKPISEFNKSAIRNMICRIHEREMTNRNARIRRIRNGGSKISRTTGNKHNPVTNTDKRNKLKILF